MQSCCRKRWNMLSHEWGINMCNIFRKNSISNKASWGIIFGTYFLQSQMNSILYIFGLLWYQIKSYHLQVAGSRISQWLELINLLLAGLTWLITKGLKPVLPSEYVLKFTFPYWRILQLYSFLKGLFHAYCFISFSPFKQAMLIINFKIVLFFLFGIIMNGSLSLQYFILSLQSLAS